MAKNHHFIGPALSDFTPRRNPLARLVADWRQRRAQPSSVQRRMFDVRLPRGPRTAPSKSKIQNPKSKIQNPKSKIQNPKSKIQNTPPSSIGHRLADSNFEVPRKTQARIQLVRLLRADPWHSTAIPSRRSHCPSWPVLHPGASR